MAVGTCAVLTVIGGGVAGVAALTNHRAEPRFVTAVGDAATAGAAPETAAPAAPAPPAPAPQIATGQMGTGEVGAGQMGTGQVGAGQVGAGQVGAGQIATGQVATGQIGTGQIGTGKVGAVTARSRTAAKADRRTARAGAPPPAQAPPRSGTSRVAAPAKPPAQPVITTRTETETREVPYSTRTVRDSSLPRGVRQVQSPGVAGQQTLRYLVTLTDGRPTARRLLDSTVTRQPKPRIVALGDQVDDPQSDDQPFGGWHGWGQWSGDPGSGHCRARFDLCVPFGRAATCSDGYAQRVEDGRAVQRAGGVAVDHAGADVDVPSGGRC